MLEKYHRMAVEKPQNIPNAFAVNQRLMDDHIGESFTGFHAFDQNTAAFLEGGEAGMVRRLCPIATLATIVNTGEQQRLVDGKDAPIRLGDMLRKLASYHKKPGMISDEQLQQPGWNPEDAWQVFDSKGRIRYHAIATAAEAFDIPTAVVDGLPVSDLTDLLAQRAMAGVSVANSFVKLSDPDPMQLEPSGHIIPLLQMTNGIDHENPTITTADPYAHTAGLAGLRLPLRTLVAYLPQGENQEPFIRGIIFAKDRMQLAGIQEYKPRNAFTPQPVIEELRTWIAGKTAIS